MDFDTNQKPKVCCRAMPAPETDASRHTVCTTRTLLRLCESDSINIAHSLHELPVTHPCHPDQ